MPGQPKPLRQWYSWYYTLATHIVLNILIDAPDFGLETYKHKTSSVFTRPRSGYQLHASRDTATRQYMLDLLHIEEASYEGNDKVLGEWFRMTRPLVWVGNQLTVGHIQGLKKFRSMDLNSFDRLEFIVPVFGWFHAQIAMEHSLHSLYYGTCAGHGLVHMFNLLKRKGLHAPLVQGVYHQNIKEALYHIATAQFCDLWCMVTGVENLWDLRELTLEVLQGLATWIVWEFTSRDVLSLATCRSKEDRDDVLSQAILWNKDILDYITLNSAVSWGDVGMIQDLLPHLLFRFNGGMNSKYAIEVLELLQCLHRDWLDDMR
ncbi:hypothetical protein BC827DRAFT_1293535 [Russula dissimulans]|nr:hypothetical protein BC827DRAFT_1293535 [Russula dissimulans]